MWINVFNAAFNGPAPGRGSNQRRGSSQGVGLLELPVPGASYRSLTVGNGAGAIQDGRNECPWRNCFHSSACYCQSAIPGNRAFRAYKPPICAPARRRQQLQEFPPILLGLPRRRSWDRLAASQSRRAPDDLQSFGGTRAEGEPIAALTGCEQAAVALAARGWNGSRRVAGQATARSKRHAL